MTRRTRQVGTIVLTAAAIGYLFWKVELGTTLDVLAYTNLAWFALAVAIMLLTVPVLALRWGWLLAAHLVEAVTPPEWHFVVSGKGDQRSFVLHLEAMFALAWLLAHSTATLPIPGTSSIVHLEENLEAAALRLDAEDLTERPAICRTLVRRVALRQQQCEHSSRS